jgi:two-component system NtrC family sensor kinase
MRKIILITLVSFFLKEKIIAQNNYRDSLKQQLTIATNDTLKIYLLVGIGFTYAFIYEDTAIIYANQALNISQKTRNKSGEAFSSHLLSLSLTLLGNFTSGLQYGLDFLSIGKKLNDTSMQVLAYDDLGICYREQEDYNEALKYEYKAEALSRMANLRGERGNVLGTLTSIYERTNRLDSALHYAGKAYELVKDWSGLYLNLGNIYAKLDQKDTALYYYRKGIPLAAQSLIYIDLVDIYNKMSSLFESMNNKDSSIYYANKSITQEGVLTYPEGRLRALLQLAKLYESEGLKDSTIKYLKLSAALHEKLFGREKTRETQNLAFNEKLHQQQLAATNQQERNRMKMYGLLTVIIVFLVIAFILWRNNTQKQKTNRFLENTLSNLKSTQAQLIQSEKMASLGELTAGIAHEIQNPLNFVNNFSDVNKELLKELKEEADKGNIEEIKAIANDVINNEEKINHHGKRADAIVKNMLQHSRSSGATKELTDINRLADEYLRLSYHGLRAKDKSFNAEIKTDFDKTIDKINIVPQDIGRVLLNLINNAFYAVNEKLRAQSSQLTADYKPLVSVQTKKINNEVQIRVSDNGNGIPRKVLDKIFQPFFTTKPTGQGTGLGLSLSYDIIKAHGGEIKVENGESEGVEFIIQLPIINN